MSPELDAPLPGARTILFGGSGFLGSCILKCCPQMISVGRTRPPVSNRHVHIDSLADLRVLDTIEFDRAIVLVGTSHHSYLGKSTWVPGELTAFDYHLAPTLQILERLKDFPIRKLLHFSTVLLYDQERLSLPVHEDAVLNPYRTRYILSKHLSEEACRFYSRWIPIVNVRLSNMYGPSVRERWDIIHVLAKQLAATGTATVQSMEPARDFIYVDDAADAAVKLLDSDFTGTVNLGSGSATTIRQVAGILERISGGSITNADAGFDGPAEFRCDIRRISDAARWMPRKEIEDGIRLVYESIEQ